MIYSACLDMHRSLTYFRFAFSDRSVRRVHDNASAASGEKAEKQTRMNKVSVDVAGKIKQVRRER